MEIMPILLLASILGLIPAAIAHSKGGNFVGWWFFGALLFIIALPCALFRVRDTKVLEQRSITNRDQKKCPDCAELVKVDANVCRFCGHRFSEPPVAA